MQPVLVRHRLAPHLRPFVSAIIGYEERGAAPPEQREPASLDVPIIVTLAGHFRIALDRPAAVDDRLTSFAAGLHPGYVAIASDGSAACVQLNFTPLGARLALALPMHELASRMVPLDDLPPLGLGTLADRLAAAPGWPARLALAEAWALDRLRAGPALDRQVLAADRLIRRSGGAQRIAAVADTLGWSRKRLVARFRDEVGVGPKTLARIYRFRRAARLARAPAPDWADIAAACGYSDQPHLVREFRAFTGSTPAAWFAARG